MDIFVSDDDTKKCLTKTIILETIPDRTIKYDKDWRKKKLTQWTWKFFTINDRNVVTISYMKWNSDKEYYYILNKNKWSHRTISPEYNKYITEIYYLYVND